MGLPASSKTDEAKSTERNSAGTNVWLFAEDIRNDMLNSCHMCVWSRQHVPSIRADVPLLITTGFSTDTARGRAFGQADSSEARESRNKASGIDGTP